MHAQMPSPSAIGWLRYAIPPDPPRYHEMPHVVVLLGEPGGQARVEEETAFDELDRGLGHMVAGTDILLRRFDPTVDAIILATPEAVHRARLAHWAPGFVEKPLPEDGFRIVHLRRGIRHWWLLEGGSPRAEIYAALRFSALVAEDRQLPEDLMETPQIPLRAAVLQGNMPEPALLRQYARLLAAARMNGVVLQAKPETPANGESAAAQPAAGATVAEAERIFRPYGIRVWKGLAALEAEQKQTVVPATFADAPMSGLPTPAALTPQAVVELPLLPGGVRQPVVSLQAWQRLIASGMHPAALLATISAEAVRPLPEQPLLHAALYALGRVMWTPSISREEIVEEWARQTWGDDARIFGVAKKIVLENEDSYTAITSPLGLPRLGTANGPDPATAARAASPSHPLADHTQIGADRLATNQWPAELQAKPEQLPYRCTGIASGMLSEGQDFSPAVKASQREAALAPEGISPQISRETCRTAQNCTDCAADDRWLLLLHRVPLGFSVQPKKEDPETEAAPANKPVANIADAKTDADEDEPGTQKTTVLQAVYNAEFTGAVAAVNAADAWDETRALVDAERWGPVHDALEESSRRADIWREATTEWLLRTTGIPDPLGFAGHYTGRVEAEAMTLNGYREAFTAEKESASGGAYVACGKSPCTATTVFHGEADVYRVAVAYFDSAQPHRYLLLINGKTRAAWNSTPRHGEPGGTTAERFLLNGVRFSPGDHVEIRSTGPLDFVEITRDPRWN